MSANPATITTPRPTVSETASDEEALLAWVANRKAAGHDVPAYRLDPDEFDIDDTGQPNVGAAVVDGRYYLVLREGTAVTSRLVPLVETCGVCGMFEVGWREGAEYDNFTCSRQCSEVNRPTMVEAKMPAAYDTNSPFVAGLEAWQDAAEAAGLTLDFSSFCWDAFITGQVNDPVGTPDDDDLMCGVVGVGGRYCYVVRNGEGTVYALPIDVVHPCFCCGNELTLGPDGERTWAFSAQYEEGVEVCSTRCEREHHRIVNAETAGARIVEALTAREVAAIEAPGDSFTVLVPLPDNTRVVIGDRDGEDLNPANGYQATCLDPDGQDIGASDGEGWVFRSEEPDGSYVADSDFDALIEAVVAEVRRVHAATASA
jgi:hypothetical protein